MNAHVIAWRFKQVCEHTAAAAKALDLVGKERRESAAKFAAQKLAEECQSAQRAA
jgi:hypothetical protein